MIKKSIYPKTKRVPCRAKRVEITEKLDGSNLCIFKKNDVLYLAQRKFFISFDELDDYKNDLYKGLYQWIKNNKEELNSIRNNSVICGEWLGMGKLKYDFPKKFYMFAKANVDDDFNLYNIFYYHDLFGYCFKDNKILDCIGIVPVVYTSQSTPSKLALDELYKVYCKKVNRNVEGFIVNYENVIRKYIRMKKGKLTDHCDKE